MTTGPPSPPTSQHPAAPPTHQGAVVDATLKPGWPVVFGVLSIVFGVGGAVSGLGTAGAWFFGHSHHAYVWSQTIVSTIHCFLGLLLLVSGFFLLRFRKFGVRGCIVWSWLRIGHGLWTAIVFILAQRSQMQGMAGSGAGILEPIVVGAIFLGVFAWAAAFPVVMLIWFSRKKIKQDIARHFIAAPGNNA